MIARLTPQRHNIFRVQSPASIVPSATIASAKSSVEQVGVDPQGGGGDLRVAHGFGDPPSQPLPPGVTPASGGGLGAYRPRPAAVL